ncbi:MAG: transglycosylase domain-containing protein [Oscillospiraceae bacterium]|nr:transglycosylase domain-containing protein [Oscillospiraceae bacterium]
MKKKKALKIALWIVLGLIGLVILITGFFAIKGAVMWSSAKKDLSITRAAENLRADERFTPFEELPQFYIDAVISVEDRRFFTHGGINVKSIIRAALYDIKNQTLEQGGSTITQQLAKNVWFSQEKKLERKFAEVWAAFDLEKELDKNEIFELYVNTIYFGSDYYGITDAAHGYFGKSPAELSEYECAMLAGLPNAPSVYSPDESPELARQRLELVLQAMRDNDKLSDNEAQQVLAQGEGGSL